MKISMSKKYEPHKGTLNEIEPGDLFIIKNSSKDVFLRVHNGGGSDVPCVSLRTGEITYIDTKVKVLKVEDVSLTYVDRTEN